MTGNLNKTDTICIFINQLREKIGVMFSSPKRQHQVVVHSEVLFVGPPRHSRIESLKDRVGSLATGRESRW
ncbi:MAG: hypothetical protein R2706_03795 [Acidimicrobiales bacterium]